MPKRLTLERLAVYGSYFSGRLNEDRIAAIREQWRGKLVIKGIVSEDTVKPLIWE